uniref:B-cell linker protein n=1 Tax=Lygus hesperus TaxID=30085 RepID=A0A0A9WX97_LYGHE
MCTYLALTGSLLRGIFRRVFNDLIDWIVFQRNSFCPTGNATIERNYEDRPWFHRVDRRRGQQLVEEGGNGCFLVRPSTKHMLTLSLWYNGRAYNIPIRRRDDAQYSLGTMKPNERVFTDLDEIVDHYGAREELILFSKGTTTGRCRLLRPARKLEDGAGTYRAVSEPQETTDDPESMYIIPSEQCVIHM